MGRVILLLSLCVPHHGMHQARPSRLISVFVNMDSENLEVQAVVKHDRDMPWCIWVSPPSVPGLATTVIV